MRSCGFIVATVGAVLGGLLLIGGLVLFRMAAADDPAHIRIARNNPATVAAIQAASPGQEVVVEGWIGWEAGTVEDGVLVYARDVPDPARTNGWQEIERHTPPLLIELPDGVVAVRGDYLLEAPAEVIAPDQRLRGLRRGMQTTVVGVVRPGAAGMEIEALLVRPGSRMALLNVHDIGPAALGLLSYAVLAIGAVLASVGGAALAVMKLIGAR